jgi:hypothetical protein
MMRRAQYTAEQKEMLLTILNNPQRQFLSASHIMVFTKEFNEKFNETRSPKAIAAQFRELKTKNKLPVRIAFKGISDPAPHNVGDRANLTDSPRPVKKFGPTALTLLKELGVIFCDITRQNMEMKRELQKLAVIRSAVDRYRNDSK